MYIKYKKCVFNYKNNTILLQHIQLAQQINIQCLLLTFFTNVHKILGSTS